MPRPKKTASLPIDEQIGIITAEIERLKLSLKEKKEELKVLQAKKESADQKKVLDAIENSGLSYDDVLKLVSDSSK